MPNRKLEIVRRLLPAVSDDKRPTEKHAMITWWANIREDGGLRLTKHGYDMLDKIFKLESWIVQLPEKTNISKRDILEMDRKLCWPYYIRTKGKKQIEIVFFSSREAMMATLYGDLKAWIASCEYRPPAGNSH